VELHLGLCVSEFQPEGLLAASGVRIQGIADRAATRCQGKFENSRKIGRSAGYQIGRTKQNCPDSAGSPLACTSGLRQQRERALCAAESAVTARRQTIIFYTPRIWRIGKQVAHA